MSSFAPGPRREEWFKAPVERPSGAPKETGDDGAVRPPRPDETHQLSSAGPPALRTLFAHERKRSAARSADQMRLANAALRDVVGDLDVLLATAAAHLRESGHWRSRRRAKKVVPQLVTIAELNELPFDEVADFLGLPATEADSLLGRLTRQGGISREERQQALDQIEQLRVLLQEVEITRNHSLLDRLVGFIGKIALLVGIAVGSTPLGALAVGDSVMSEVIKTGVIALVAQALQHAVDTVREWQTEHDPYVVAHEAHTALLSDLLAAQTLTKTPAYEGEHAVLRFKLEVRCARARVASLPLAWEDKTQYWLALDDIATALDHESATALPGLQRRLWSLTPPGPA